jgi:hypothetical protein
VIIEKNEKCYLYQYEYKDGVVTLSIDFVELEEVYRPKSFERKSGASLSAQNRETLTGIHAQIEACHKDMKKFLDGTMPMEPMQTAQMTAQMTMPMMEPMKTAMRTAPAHETTIKLELTEEFKSALEEIKSQVLLLSQNTTAKEFVDMEAIAKEMYRLQIQIQKDAPKDINLDAIELPKVAKDPADIELDIEPGELKTMIQEIVKNSIQGGN